MGELRSTSLAPWSVRHLARRVLGTFVLTFLISRVVVLLIMTGRMPDLYLFVGQTHVHHLNYGIFILVGVCGWMIFQRPGEVGRNRAALLYGVGLGLTFDEFGMWLHLGGSYWQRASFDAVITVGGLLGLLAFAPSLRYFRLKHWLFTAAIIITLITAASLAAEQLQVLGAFLHRIEQSGPAE